jgi:hypothetical protein
MKRLALVAAVLALAACKTKEEAPPADTTAAPAMAPAPAADSMKKDSAMMKMDTGMKMDSMKKDTLKKKP